ncbi:MAG TPA: glycoside hydrolase family 38 C-terminal domain-containing protein [Phycisphaerales bacterium]|nr:glycoside hydrolase family 38 C-terminal domain-containing protein [Phycisphaerales bacterium]
MNHRPNVCLVPVLLCLAGSTASLTLADDQSKPAAPPEKATPPPAPPAPPDIDITRQPTLYVVGYAHLDTEWRWAYPQTIREFIPNTLHDNFKLFDKYPSYVFNFSGSRRYQMMEEYYPADFERLKKYVAQGRWFPCGSSVDENDANVPSAESYVRHVLYGNNYFRREFGLASEEFMLPDCFGFPAALPSVLAHCGLKGFSTQKLTWGLAIGKIPFKVGMWQGPDGRSLMAALDPGAYVGDVKENLATSESWARRIDDNGSRSGVYADYHYYGTGDQGGAPRESSVEMVEKSVNTRNAHTVVVSGPADWMFRTITPEMREHLPAYTGELELTEHSAGSITSQAYMKRCNRKNELLADSAERAAALDWWLGSSAYPGRRIEEAWLLVLGSQMHDILPGTSLPPAYEYAWNDEVLAANLFADILTSSVGGVSSAMDTRAKGTPVLLYNPLACAREDAVELTIPWTVQDAQAGAIAIAPDGSRSPVQVLEKLDSTARVVFSANMPPAGFALYDIQYAPRSADPAGTITVTTNSLENERYLVKIDAQGDVASVFDKSLKKELLTAPARLGLHFERPANWPAWNQDWADRRKPARSYVGGPAKITVAESGPVRGAVRVEREQDGSVFVQHIRLASGPAGDSVVFHTDIDWNTRERSLRAAFPLTASNPSATYDIQTGVIERGNGHAKQFEYAAHQWFDLTDASGAFGVSVLNDSKYGSDKPDDRTLRQTLLYTPGVRANYRDQGTQDLGKHEMVYALSSHAGDWRTGAWNSSPWKAARLNQPIVAFIVPKHEGPLGKSLSLLTCDNPSVMVTAVKKAEGSDDLIVRLRELSGKDAPGVRITLAGAAASAVEVDGQERPIAPAKVESGALLADVHGYGLRAFAVKVAPPAHAAKPVQSAPIALAFDTDVVSTNAKRTDGAMEAGRAYPAEQFGTALTIDGVRFTLGPTADGEKNALACTGQEIPLPAGVERIEFLAAASDADTVATFSVGTNTAEFTIPVWRGFIGQWDNRRWAGTPVETDDRSYHTMVGLDPGYIKQAPVAWYASHHHTATQDEHYKYSYLFRFAMGVPKGGGGASSLKLPAAPGVKLFALTGVRAAHDQALAASTLRDTLADHRQDALRVTSSGAPADSVQVTIAAGLYWRDGAVRYTTDGSDPTPSSPAYDKPFWLAKSATIKAAAFDYAGQPGPIASRTIEVSDTTGPTLTGASTVFQATQVTCRFSEPVDAASGSRAANYTLSSGAKIIGALVAPNGLSAVVTMDQPLPAGAPVTLRVSGITDRSPAANAMAAGSADLSVRGPVYRLDVADAAHQGSITKGVKNLPTRADQPWTINMWVRTDKRPESHTVFAGFGRCEDTANGTGRYLCRFGSGIHFWSRNADVDTRVQLDLNTWQMLTATSDGSTIRIYKDGVKIAEQPATLADDEPTIAIMPADPWEKRIRFNGDLRDFTIWDACLSEESLKAIGQSFKP